MKILSTEQIKALDKYTIEHEPVSSVNLMERAALKFTGAVSPPIHPNDNVFVFCGMGNNGGDGIAVARQLIERGYKNVKPIVVKHTTPGSADFLFHLERLKDLTRVNYIDNASQVPVIKPDDIVIDAIFGSGLSRPVSGIAAEVISAINRSGASVYSIDVPSGLYCDQLNAAGDTVIRATAVYTFHAPKLSFLLAANGAYVPHIKVLDIGLAAEFAASAASTNFYITGEFIKPIFRKREKFSHKGTYGHALIAAGSYGKMGAAVLATKAALRSGTGLVTSHIPKCGYEIMQTANPEAMAVVDPQNEFLSTVPELNSYSAIGIGPALGTHADTVAYLKSVLTDYKKPLVLDADALNIIAENKSMLSLLPANSILTPHPGEFKRLAGDWNGDLEKLRLQTEFSKANKVIVVLKGANTSVSTPGGQVYFNSTGNAGMATGGSGDVLTGVIIALLAQGYSAEHAAVIGVYIHGLAGDQAKAVLGETGIKAMDIVYYLPKAFKQLENGL